MGKRLDELNLGSEQIEGVTQDDLPEQFGSRPDPPQPGPYRFKLPDDMTQCYDTMEVTINGNKTTRLTAIFDEQFPLTIVQSPKGEHNGDPFETRISNAERKRDRAGTMASDQDYLLAKGMGVALPKARNNKWYLEQMQQCSGKEFGADIEYQWFCSENRDIRMDDGSGSVQVVEGRKGCGSRYYQNDVDRDEDGQMPVRITCANPDCGAQLRAFAQLTRFRA